MEAVHQLLRALDRAELAQLRAELRAILDARGRADADQLIAWHSFSSLELAGVAALAELRLASGTRQAPRPSHPHAPLGILHHHPPRADRATRL